MAENKAAETKAKEPVPAVGEKKVEGNQAPDNGTFPPMNPKEKKLLACTMLQIMKLEADRQELRLFKDVPKNVSKEKTRKVKALMLIKCLKEINDEMVEKVCQYNSIFS